MMILVHSHKYTHAHLCLALSLSKQPFYSERLQWSGSAPAKTPFHTSSLSFSKTLPPVWPQGLPSFLLTQRAWGSHRGVRMAGCALIKHTDRQTNWVTRNRQAERRMLLLLWTLGLVFFPIRCYKENDIIPVLIGQQEGEGEMYCSRMCG